MQKLIKDVPIHFVLSGGAAKGFVHIGVLRAFEQIGIIPASITGTSAGALFGAIWAMTANYNECKKKIDQFMESEVYKNFTENYLLPDIGNKKNEEKESIFSFFKKKEKFKNKFSKISSAVSEKFFSVIKGTKAFLNLFDDEALVAIEDINKIYEAIYLDTKIEELKIPFIAVASDIRTKSVYCFKQGKLSTAVAASTAIPFIFPSVRFDDMILYDGGLVANLPVNESIENFGNGIRIGVDVSSPPVPLDEDANFMEIIQQIISTSIWSKQITDRKICDILFAPVKDSIGWFDFYLKDQLIETGFKAVIERKDEVIQRLNEIINANLPKKGLLSIFKK
jgi:NTE family protein